MTYGDKESEHRQMAILPDAIKRKFVNYLGSVVDQITSRPPSRQNIIFHTIKLNNLQPTLFTVQYLVSGLDLV